MPELMELSLPMASRHLGFMTSFLFRLPLGRYGLIPLAGRPAELAAPKFATD